MDILEILKNKKLTPVMLEYVIDCVEKIEYGRVIIELNEHCKSIDVTIEQKQRFQK